MSTYDAPNQQVVRGDGSGPGIDPRAQEARERGSSAAADETTDEQVEPELEDKTKDDLVAYARELGITPGAMTKAELVEAIREVEGEG